MAPFDRLRRICRQAVADRVTPGLVVLVGAAGRTLFHDAFGQRQVEPVSWPATPETVYDLASLAKALVTSVLAMQAVAEGRLALADLAPGRAGAESATLRLLLAHATGLPAHRPFYAQALANTGLAALVAPPAARAAVVALASAEPLVYLPGSRSLYSDVGFILLGDVIERALGGRLDALAVARLWAPLAITGMGFPVGPSSEIFAGRPVAPTERCALRGRLLVGEVHDLNAYAMGGVAGHAGLFGAADAIAVLVHSLCAAWRDAGIEGGAPAVPSPVLRAFWAPAGIAGSTWRLGWDGPAPAHSLAGTIISRAAVGHLGFTGCSLWIDPERETFVLVLANRVHPTVRDDPRFRSLRPALNDAALEGAGYPTR